MYRPDIEENLVVICFHFSNFEPLETALKLSEKSTTRCDLLSF